MFVLGKHRWRVALAMLAVAATSIAGCGADDDQERDRVEQRIETLQTAFDTRDLRDACRGMTERAQLLITYMAHAAAPSCEASLRRLKGWMANGDRSVIGPAPAVEDVDVDGRRAVATIEQRGSRPYSVRMASSGERWKLDGVFDAGASTFQELSDVPPDPPSPPPPTSGDGDAAEVSTSASDGDACPSVRLGGAGGVSGGCVLSLSRAKLTMSVLNLFGRMPLADCRLRLTLHVDSRGRTWADDFQTVGPRACGDIRGCESNQLSSQHRPWHGRIERGPDGRLRHRFVDVCLDTCVGEYRGDWAVGMKRHGRGWRLRSSAAMVGSSGWLFKGTLDSRPSELAVTAGSSG